MGKAKYENNIALIIWCSAACEFIIKLVYKKRSVLYEVYRIEK
ncbi:hypothetical protein CLOSBL3_12370 [Clostridiaceae bacterium BL-3]|mgnify:CR=1 FL=1|nr:hypothetical protein CLOSBL3_12370 [Clostridiaceae bacterium BL-3]